MRVVRAADNPTFDLQGNTIAGLAAPRSGCSETIMYRLVVPSGAETPAHEHDHEEVFHLASGSLDTTLGDDAETVETGDTVIIPAGVRHSVRSTGGEDAALLCVMPAGTLFIKPDGSAAVPPWGSELMATYFSNVKLFDGHTLKTKAGVLVADGTISWVGAHARAPKVAQAAHQEDGTGRTLLPGLIDAHVHLTASAAADFEAAARGLNDARAALQGARNAIRYLERGVTTVRDLGSVHAVSCDVARGIEAGLIPGPRVIAAGEALTITGGHGHGFFAREVDGPENLRHAVREQMRSGARAIKVIATGGVLTSGISVDFTAFTPEELAAAVDEAHSWGRGIAAHAIGATGIENAVRAGVDSIEHGSQITAATARLMKERGTFHVPTISALQEIIENRDEVPEFAVAKAEEIIGQAQDSFRRAIRAGVRHACGTDAGTPFNLHGNTPLEIVRMVEWGMTELKALQAATAHAAELLRVPEIGTVEEGKTADLVLYDGDPAEEIDLILKPALVMKGGEVVAGSGA